MLNVRCLNGRKSGLINFIGLCFVLLFIKEFTVVFFEIESVLLFRLGLVLSAIGLVLFFLLKYNQDSNKSIHSEIAGLEDYFPNKLIFENLNDAICISNSKGICIHVNDAFQKLFGYSRSEIKGKSILELVTEDEFDRIQEYIKNRPFKKDLPIFYESKGIRKDKSTFPFEIKTSTYNNNNEVFSIAIIRDISERKLAEESLKESEERFRLLADQSTDMISRHAADGTYLYVSAACERLLGHTPREMIGKSAFDFIFEGDVQIVEDSLNAILSDRIVSTTIFRGIRKDGSLIWLETTSETIIDPQTKAIVEIHAATRDVSKRKEIESALKSSEEKFIKIFDRAPVLISMTDFETGIYVDVNHFSLEFSGYTKEEVIGKRSVDVGWITAENRKLLVDTITKYGRIDALEMPFTTKRGEIVYAIINAEKIQLDGKNYLLSIATDISARKRAEVALAENQTLYSNIFEQSPIGLQYYNHEGLLLKLNNACLDIFGVVDIEDIKDWNLFNDPNVTKEIKESLVRGEMVRYVIDFDFELVIYAHLYRTTKSGIRIFDVTLSALGFGYFAQIIDVTDKQLAEKQLIIAKNKAEENEKRFANAIAATSDAIWEWNLKTRETFFSPRWFQMLGYENQEFKVSTETMLSICHPNDYEIAIGKIRNCIDNYVSYSAEFRMQKKDGSWCWILGRGDVVEKDEDGKALIFSGTNTDITERKLLDDELLQHRKHLETLVRIKTEEIEATSEEIRSTNDILFEKNQIIEQQNSDLNKAIEHLKETQAQLFQTEKMASLGVLTAGVAHEINNPLNYIMGAYEGLNVVLTETQQIKDENVPLLLQSLKIGVDRVSMIVNGLNQFSRSNNINNERCDLQSIIENCLLILNKQYKDRIEIRKKIGAEQVVALGNSGKLHQVFTNILSNSIHAISGNGLIDIRLYTSGIEVIVEIIDDGIGISKENLTKITEPFFTTKDPGKGTGLGLAITYSIIKELNGHIDFQSEVGEGAKVKVSLPSA